LFRHAQCRVGRHRPMLSNPCSKRFAHWLLRDVNIVLTVSCKLENLGNIRVTQPLNGASQIFKTIAQRRINAFDWHDGYCDRFPGSFIDTLVHNRGAVSTEFFWHSIKPKRKAVMLKQDCPLHNRGPLTAPGLYALYHR